MLPWDWVLGPVGLVLLQELPRQLLEGFLSLVLQASRHLTQKLAGQLARGAAADLALGQMGRVGGGQLAQRVPLGLQRPGPLLQGAQAAAGEAWVGVGSPGNLIWGSKQGVQAVLGEVQAAKGGGR